MRTSAGSLYASPSSGLVCVIEPCILECGGIWDLVVVPVSEDWLYSPNDLRQQPLPPPLPAPEFARLPELHDDCPWTPTMEWEAR